jgi:alpha-beta hydrolase superfamily lysophospholipase
MQSTEATFVPSRSADIKLRTRQWIPLDKEPAAIILFLHGFCDYLHGNDDDCPPASYHARAKRFVDWGAACVGIEQEGHGLSSGSRAYIRHLDDFTNDTFEYLTRQVITRWPDTPVFFFGESMGGMKTLAH